MSMNLRTKSDDHYQRPSLNTEQISKPVVYIPYLSLNSIVVFLVLLFVANIVAFSVFAN